MNSASLCSLAGQYDNPIPPRFLAPIDSLKIPALYLLALLHKSTKQCTKAKHFPRRIVKWRLRGLLLLLFLNRDKYTSPLFLLLKMDELIDLLVHLWNVRFWRKFWKLRLNYKSFAVILHAIERHNIFSFLIFYVLYVLKVHTNYRCMSLTVTLEKGRGAYPCTL